MTLTFPAIDPRGWYPIGKAAELLGCSRATLREASLRGKRKGGVDAKVGNNGRKKFLGRELLRYWEEH